MNHRIKKRIGAALFAAAVFTGIGVAAAAPAQAASSSCSFLSYGYHDIAGRCQSGNPAGNPYVSIGYSCWGSAVNHSVLVNVGYGTSFDVTVTGCEFGITGVWLIA